MSRVGMLPVEVPDGVDLQIVGGAVKAKGKLGELSLNVSDDVQVSREENLIWVKPANNSKRARTMWGTTRSLINNIVFGVSAGFEKKLRSQALAIVRRCRVKTLCCRLGHSHEIRCNPRRHQDRRAEPDRSCGIGYRPESRPDRGGNQKFPQTGTRVRACGMRTR